MRLVLLALLSVATLALAGCKSTVEMRAEQDAADAAACQSYGAKPGTDTYVRCRTDLQRNHAIEDAALTPVVVAPPLGYGFGFGIGAACRRTPFGLRCY